MSVMMPTPGQFNQYSRIGSQHGAQGDEYMTVYYGAGYPYMMPHNQWYFHPYNQEQQPYFAYMSAPGSAVVDSNRRHSKHFSTWTKEEDVLLRELKEVRKMGWRQISVYFNDRTPNACQFRWRRLVSSNVNSASQDSRSNSDSDTESSCVADESSSNVSRNSSITPSETKKSHTSIDFLLN
ncbi:Piso0_002901 [Millerozyma farinosa CBS 7064]|uniref:Piso0_002901 protein n=1 Tax=Pichia sorbitophila (strain ATCC MYA-4447 / BCRC 22081 / CBS 7064 / NBRC 10061 / NRRL Y-12695) TaxID=559304 RepID=G8YGM3_PICSO|nr:Piso0_002901 [Millerozyma farinosa CBS 7064]CCE80575.1 Piso0_002901 [Millerozyma farinosa CBS 7064]